MNHYESPTPQSIVSNRRKYTDTRTFLVKLWDDLTGIELALALNAVFMLISVLYPHLFAVSFLVIMLTTLRCTLTRKNKTLPVKLPIELKGKFKDYNSPYPGRKKFKTALGTVMLGNTREKGQELWGEGEDLLVHGLVIGTTGAGKTETLISLVGATTFCMGGGVFYLDPKAGNKLLMQFVILCRMFGRIDDLRVLNYKKGGVAVKEEFWQKGTNTFNPFALGDSNENFQILGMLIPSEAGQNESFLASAREVMKAILPALCELRDNNILRLTPSLIADYLNLQRVADLIFRDSRNVYVPDNDENVTFELSNKSKRPIKMYLEGLQYDPEKLANQQSDAVTRSFGYAKSYYGEPLANLAANFGHIYDFEVPEISLEDIIFNNRVFLSMLPSMENPPAEQKNLGKISLSAVKQAMSLGLGSVTEGSYEDIIENIPVDLRVPFIVVADEYAEVAVPGFAVAATQGRSLGVSVIFGSQDLAGLVRADKDEAEMIFGNTLNKWLMRTQDPDTTWKKFKELASTVSVAESANFGAAEGMINSYVKERNAVIKEVDRIHFNDIASQMQGEAHYFERGNVHRINTFYHFMDEEKNGSSFRYNRLLPIIPPSDRLTSEIKKYLTNIAALESSHKSNDIYPDIDSLNEDNAWHGDVAPMSLFAEAVQHFNREEVEAGDVSEVANGDTVEISSPPADAQKEKPKAPTSFKMTKGRSTKSTQDLDELNQELNSQHDSEDGQGDKPSLKSEIAQELANESNHWLFSVPEGDEQSVAQKLSERLKMINRAVYDDSEARCTDDEVDAMVASAATETPYTSNPPVKPQRNDAEQRWNSINELFSVSD